MLLNYSIDPDTVLSIVEQGSHDRLAIPAAEEALVRDARSPGRKVEFGLGRGAARQALAVLSSPQTTESPLSLADLVIGRGSLGEPLWPVGYTGSISHTRIGTPAGSGAAYGAAVVGRTPPLRLYGLDIESLDRSLPEALPTRICTPSERAWITSHSYSSQLPNTREVTAISPRMLTLAPPPIKALAIFVLKEAVYKALSPLVREPIGFQEAEISASEETIGVELIPALVSKVPSKHFRMRQAPRIHPTLYSVSGILIGIVTL